MTKMQPQNICYETDDKLPVNVHSMVLNVFIYFKIDDKVIMDATC